MKEQHFIIVEWPDSQELMELDGFEENTCLINDNKFIEENLSIISSAYFVNIDWMEKHNLVNK